MKNQGFQKSDSADEEKATGRGGRAQGARLNPHLAMALGMVALFLPFNAHAAEQVQFSRGSCGFESQVQPASAASAAPDQWVRDVKRSGNRVVVTKKLADAAKKDDKIVLSKVAVRSRLDAEGELRSYELVQVDKGSVVEKMGLRPGDQLVAVNGIPVRNLEEKRKGLEGSNRFSITIMRKGKPVKLNVEIK